MTIDMIDDDRDFAGDGINLAPAAQTALLSKFLNKISSNMPRHASIFAAARYTARNPLINILQI